jgi:uncharacterized delta-60 repeat protein
MHHVPDKSLLQNLSLPGLAVITFLAASFCGEASTLFPLDGWALESDPAAVITLTRDAASTVESVEYYTMDGSAQAGRDYFAKRGAASFDVGSTSAIIEIPLVDNSLVNAAEPLRTFIIVFTNASIGTALVQTQAVVSIYDNEISSGIDFDYLPELSLDEEYFDPPAVVQPDGKLLILASAAQESSGIQSRGLVRFNSNGTKESGLDQTVSDELPRAIPSIGQRAALLLLPDASVLVAGKKCGEGLAGGQTCSNRLVRVGPNGHLQRVLTIPETTSPEIRLLAAHADGRVLISLRTDENYLPVRLDADFSIDPTFQTNSLRGFDVQSAIVQPSGKIVVVCTQVTNDIEQSVIVRLESNGALDSNFQVSQHLAALEAFAAPEGKIMVGRNIQSPPSPSEDSVFRLNADGSMDSTFRLDNRFGADVRLLGVIPDGRAHISADLHIFRIASDGSLDVTFTPARLSLTAPCSGCFRKVVSAPDGAAFVLSNYGTVNGVAASILKISGKPRPGSKSFLWGHYTPLNASEGDDAVNIRLLRTGDTTRAASVTFSTQDGTALAGRDYFAQSARIEFAPLEVERNIQFQLPDNGVSDGDRSFRLVLNEPSVGYDLPAAGTTVIVRDNDPGFPANPLRLLADGRAEVSIRNPFCGLPLYLQASTDLLHWTSIATNSNCNSVVSLGDPGASNVTMRFYRLVSR